MKIFKVLLSFPDVSYVLVTGWIIHKTDTRDQDTKIPRNVEIILNRATFTERASRLCGKADVERQVFL